MNLTAGSVSGQIETLAIARPRPGMSVGELAEHFADLGNDVVEVTNEGIVAIHDIDRFTSPTDGEYVWTCDFCGCFHEFRSVIERHELTCKEKT